MYCSKAILAAILDFCIREYYYDVVYDLTWYLYLLNLGLGMLDTKEKHLW